MLISCRLATGEPGVPCESVFVGNLSWNITEDALNQAFAECGTISVRFIPLPNAPTRGRAAWLCYLPLSAPFYLLLLRPPSTRHPFPCTACEIYPSCPRCISRGRPLGSAAACTRSTVTHPPPTSSLRLALIRYQLAHTPLCCFSENQVD